MKKLVLFFLILSSFFSFSQKTKEYSISWKSMFIDGIEIFHVKGQKADVSSLPSYNEKIKIGNNQNILVSSSILEKELVSKSDLVYLSEELIEKIENKVSSTVFYGFQNKQKYAIISYTPLVKLNGSYYKITKFKSSFSIIDLPVESSSNRSGNRSFKSTSVLSSSDFYKLSLRKNGVYKLSYEFLESNGVLSGSVNSNLINIYGNHNGMLSETNGDFRIDDLEKNSIKVVDGADGNFDKGDYILFYGQSPDKWKFNSASNSFEFEKHLYSDDSYLFITVNDNSGAKRVNTLAPITSPHTVTVSTFNDFAVKEDERINLLKSAGKGGSGKLWVGDVYDAVLSYNYGFSFPNIDVSSPVDLRTAVYAVSPAGYSSSFNVSVGSLGSTTIPIIGFPQGVHSSVALLRTGNLSFSPSSSNFNVNYTFSKPLGVQSSGWLDYIEINCRRNLIMSGNQLEFRDVTSINTGTIADYMIQQASNIQEIWDVTNPITILGIPFQKTGTNLSFKQQVDSLRTYIAITGNGYLEPQFVNKVESQNLHGSVAPDMLIVYHPLFKNQVDQLVNFHRGNGLDVLIASVQEIYNEFSCGMQDVSAIKTFAKMLYDRGGGTKLKYLLLFGDGSYDYKGRVIPNHNFVPVWESPNSLSDVTSFTTDDFYALLDDGESMGDYELMDVAVGRFTVVNQAQAQNVVNKVINYQKAGSSTSIDQCNNVGSGSAFGDWRNKLTFVADDVDENWEQAFVYHTEKICDSVNKNYPTFNFNKVYMDAYNQTSQSGGERYPEGLERIKKAVQEGSLITTYEGHGGEIGWGSERFLDIPTINGWTNTDRLSVFLTATCEFTKYDDPSRGSAGELCFLNPNGAAIALFTTTRAVYQFSNERLIDAFFEEAFVKKADGTPRTMGEIYMATKNNNRVIGDNNVRRFGLIGDPALNLAFPKNKVVTTEINNIPVSSSSLDTIKALSKITIKGFVADNSGNKLSAYNGVIFPTVYDKPVQLSTLGNRNPSDAIAYESQQSILYKGKASVKNGDFEFTFIVPKDINYQFGKGKISYYCFNGDEDGTGYFLDAVIGGTDLSAVKDNQGPSLGLFMNDKNFVSGGITDESPSIYAEIFDSNGINTTGNGIGHDITAILDEKTSNPIILNSYYESDLDSYQSGKVNYPLDNLAEGNHSLSLKTWDTQNNSTEKVIDFVVVKEAELAIEHVLNYPNPFTTRTQFFFEHNQHCEFLEVQIQVFTISGKLVKTLNQLVKTKGFRVEGIEWDGKDDFGDKIGRGTYVYKVKVVDSEGNKVEKYEKLVLLK